MRFASHTDAAGVTLHVPSFSDREGESAEPMSHSGA